MGKRPLVLHIIVFFFCVLEVLGGHNSSKVGFDMFDSDFVRRGQIRVLPCWMPDTFNDTTSLQCSWTKGHQEFLTDSRFHIHNNGDLEIKDCQPRDSGTYTCSYGNHTQQHNLIVYQLPEYYYETTMKYVLQNCSDINLAAEVTKITTNLCPDNHTCLYVITAACTKPVDGNDRAEVKVRLHPPEGYIPVNCSRLGCIQTDITNMLNKAYLPVKDMISEELALTSNTSQQVKLVDFDKKDASCSAGYRQFEGVVCLPCPPGTYSYTNQVKCHKCPVNHYQHQYAMASCIKCPHGMVTKVNGARSQHYCIDEKVVKVDVGGLHVTMDTSDQGISATTIALPVFFFILIATCTGVICYIKRKYFDILKSEGRKSIRMSRRSRHDQSDEGEWDDDVVQTAKQTSEVASLLEEGFASKPVKQSTMKRTVARVSKKVQQTKGGEVLVKQLGKLKRSIKKQDKDSEKKITRRSTRTSRSRDPRRSEYDPNCRYVEEDDRAYKDKRFSNQWSARMAKELSAANFLTFAEEEDSSGSDDEDMIYFDFGIDLPFADQLKKLTGVSSVPSMQEDTLQDAWNSVLIGDNPKMDMNQLLVPKHDVLGGCTGSQMGNAVFDESVNVDEFVQFTDSQDQCAIRGEFADVAVYSDLSLTKQQTLNNKGPDHILNDKSMKQSNTSTAVYSDMPWNNALRTPPYMAPELEMRKSQASTAILSDIDLSPTRGKVKGSLSNRMIGTKGVYKTSQLVAFRPKLALH